MYALLSYLEYNAATNTLHIHASKRDWRDFRSDVHFEYHVNTIEAIEGTGFSIDVNASEVPLSALMHVFLFRRLALYARDKLKNRLRQLRIIDASSATRKLHNLLDWGGYIPSETRKKIFFVDRKKSKKAN